MTAPAPPPSDCQAGWTLGLEVLALRAYQSEGQYEEGSFDVGGRASLGYQFNDCLFVKATYFGYSSDVFDETDFNENETIHDVGELKVSYLDLVVGQHFRPSEKLTLSPYVGLRWATFEENFRTTFSDGESSDSESSSSEFSGLGIVVGIDGTRALANNFSLYGTAKQSVLFGSTDFNNLEREGDDDEDGVAFVSELGLGVQYDFNFGNVAANVRAGVEGQYWAGLSGDDSENTGLAGFVLGANFRF